MSQGSIAAITANFLVYPARLLLAIVISFLSFYIFLMLYFGLAAFDSSHWFSVSAFAFFSASIWMWVGNSIAARDAFSETTVFVSGAVIPCFVFVSKSEVNPPLALLFFCLLGGSLVWCRERRKDRRLLTVSVAVPLLLFFGCVAFAYKNIFPGISKSVGISGQMVRVATDGNRPWTIKSLWVPRSAVANRSSEAVLEISLPHGSAGLDTALWMEVDSSQTSELCLHFLRIRDRQQVFQGVDPISQLFQPFFNMPCSDGRFYQRCTDLDSCELSLK